MGLAQKIYEGLSVLHYEGTIVLTEQECTGAVGMGNVLNLTGGTGAAAAWATMNAQIYEIEESLDTGETKLRVGPPVYLDAGKLVEMLRAVRGRAQSSSMDEQKTGKPDSGNIVEGAGQSPRSGGTSPPSGASAPARSPLPRQ